MCLDFFLGRAADISAEYIRSKGGEKAAHIVFHLKREAARADFPPFVF
jgi:plasmid replication initiation protein